MKKLGVIPAGVSSINIPRGMSYVYGVPNFYFGYSYSSVGSFSGSTTFSYGGVIYATSAQDVSIAQSGGPTFTFTNFVGVLPIPPNTTVTSSSSTTYNEF